MWLRYRIAKPIAAVSASSARIASVIVSSNGRATSPPGSSEASEAPNARSGSQIVSSAASSTPIPTKSARLRLPIRGSEISGARAIRVAASTRAPSAAQASGAACGLPPSTGSTENASVPIPAVQNPAARSRSGTRPSTEKRIPVRIATIVAARTTVVSSTSRPSGSSYVLRSDGLVRKSAVADPRRATSSSSPTSQDSNVSFALRCTNP